MITKESREAAENGRKLGELIANFTYPEKIEYWKRPEGTEYWGRFFLVEEETSPPYQTFQRQFSGPMKIRINWRERKYKVFGTLFGFEEDFRLRGEWVMKRGIWIKSNPLKEEFAVIAPVSRECESIKRNYNAIFLGR